MYTHFETINRTKYWIDYDGYVATVNKLQGNSYFYCTTIYAYSMAAVKREIAIKQRNRARKQIHDMDGFPPDF